MTQKMKDWWAFCVLVFITHGHYAAMGEEGGIPHYNGSSNCDDVIMDLVFVLDSSASVTEPNFELTKEFVKDFLMPADIDGGSVRVSLITYSSSADVEFHLNDHQTKSDVLKAIDEIQYHPGNTNTASALRVMREDVFVEFNGDRPNVDNVAIVMTDGTSNSRAHTFTQAQLAKAANIHIYAVGIGLTSTSELDQIASEPAVENSINVQDFSRLKTLGNKVFTTQCKCKSQADILFMLDMSGNIRAEGFDAMKQFVSDAVRDLQMTNDYSRVGLMTFSDFPKVIFHFNTYLKDKKKTREVIKDVTYIPGSTNVAMAMRVARTSMMTASNGDREGVQNILVLLTTGIHNDNHLENILEARRLKAMGTTIVSVTVGPEGKEVLHAITSPPVDGNLIEVVDLKHLPAVAGSLVHSLCYNLDPCAHNPCLHEGLCLPGLRSYTCVCHSGHYGTLCEKDCAPPADVVFLLDSSTSVGPTKFSAIKRYAQMLVTEMDMFACNINAGVVKYSSNSRIELDLGSLEFDHQLNSAIDKVRYNKGRANLANAFRMVRTRLFNRQGGDRLHAKNIVYLITGGTSKTIHGRTLSEVELLIDSGVQLIPISIDTTTLNDLTRLANIRSLPTSNYNGIEALLALSNQRPTTANTDSTDQCQPNPCHNGGICKFLTDKLTTLCVCPRGTTGQFCQNASNRKADVVFVVDTSLSHTVKDFRYVKRFLKRIVREMVFGKDKFRVAIVSFATSARIRLSLQDGRKKSAVISAIKALRRMRGTPNPARALNLINSRVLKPSKGDRSDVTNHVVLVTRSMGQAATIGAVNRLKVQGTKIIGVGLGMSAEQQRILQAAVSFPSEENLFTVGRTSDLKDMDEFFLDFISEEDNACASSPCVNEGVCTNRAQTYDCRCPAGFAGKNCEMQCDDQIDVGLVIESSASVGLNGFRHIQEFMHHLADKLNVGPNATQVGMITMGRRSRATLLLNSTANKEELHSAIAGIPYKYGAASLTTGIRLARNRLFSEAMGNRPEAPDLLVLMTSQSPDVRQDQPFLESIAAREKGIDVLAVAVGLLDKYELEGIVSPPVETNVLMAESWADLWRVEQSVMDKICRSGNACAKSPCQNGGMCTVDDESYFCTCSPGYVGDNCHIECAHRKDIAMVIDLSGDIRRTVLILSIHFLANLVEELTASGQPYRFALMTFNRTVSTILGFDSHQTPEDVVAVLHSIPYGPVGAGSDPSTAPGVTFKPVVDSFDSANGDRPDVENVAIFISQGQGTMNIGNAISTTPELQEKKVKVIGIGIGMDKDENATDIKSNQTQVFKVWSAQDLNSIKDDVITQVCSFDDIESQD